MIFGPSITNGPSIIENKHNLIHTLAEKRASKVCQRSLVEAIHELAIFK